MKINIGKYTFWVMRDYEDGTPAVWIEQKDGEGGQFDARKFWPVLENAIGLFYEQNF